ncbi:MAG: enoyl-CoA hydratase/isomerase family protein [Luminiphilus sp.]|nr:enoyl-CoA hydratase/isomerase family protein [Luminiphilus sp.]
MIKYEKSDGIHCVVMNAPANAICPEWQQRMLDVLDTIEGDCGQGASLVLAGEGKSFCTGLNLEVVSTLDAAAIELFGQRMSEIHRRLLQLPCPTVAALNGHAFAAGAFIALSCDYRIMREDRGWYCVSEVDVGVPVPPSMMGILRAKLPPSTVRDALLTGKRYTAGEAITAGIADDLAAEAELLPKALALATQLAGKEPVIFRTLKQTWMAPVTDAFAT